MVNRDTMAHTKALSLGLMLGRREYTFLKTVRISIGASLIPPQYNANTSLVSTMNPENVEMFPAILPEHGSPEWKKENTPLACTVETLQPRVHPHSAIRFEHPLLPTLDCLQKNRTSTKEAEEYKIVWTCHDNVDPDSLEGKALEDQGRGRNTANGQFVRDMKVGDIVTVWGKARFPGWVNMIETVRIDVYWAV